MKNIDIRRFVDVDIIHHVSSSSVTSRDTTVMFVDNSTYASKEKVVSSYEEALTTLGLTSESSVPERDYLKAYYENGGKKIYIKSVTLVAESESDSIVAEIKDLPDEYIVIAFPSEEAYFVEAIETLNADSTVYGIKTKLGVVGTDIDDDTYINIPHLIAAVNTMGTYEQAIVAAYLSRLNLDEQNSVKDYDFTVVKATKYSITDEELEGTMDDNVNCVAYIAGQLRVIGGNTCDGKDLVNEFALIVLQQTVTDKVLNTLTQKLKGEAGVAAISSAIAQELNKYVLNGYLSTDKVWTDEDLTISYGSPAKTYTIISKNTALLSGYQVKVLPYSSLTEADKLEHKAPPIYIVIADSYSIRKVTIKGEVI
jgi:hypothetical protein